MPIHTLSLELLTAISREYEDLEALNLSNNSISHVQNLHILSSLTKLDLSSNRIKHAGNFEDCTGLTTLCLRSNSICTLSPSLAELQQLQTLDLSRNMLRDLDDVTTILSSIPSLRKLSLQGNPCSSSPRYPAAVLDACPFLRTLDGEPTSELRASSLPSSSAVEKQLQEAALSTEGGAAPANQFTLLQQHQEEADREELSRRHAPGSTAGTAATVDEAMGIPSSALGPGPLATTSTEAPLDPEHHWQQQKHQYNHYHEAPEDASSSIAPYSRESASRNHHQQQQHEQHKQQQQQPGHWHGGNGWHSEPRQQQTATACSTPDHYAAPVHLQVNPLFLRGGLGSFSGPTPHFAGPPLQAKGLPLAPPPPIHRHLQHQQKERGEDTWEHRHQDHHQQQQKQQQEDGHSTWEQQQTSLMDHGQQMYAAVRGTVQQGGFSSAGGSLHSAPGSATLQPHPGSSAPLGVSFGQEDRAPQHLDDSAVVLGGHQQLGRQQEALQFALRYQEQEEALRRVQRQLGDAVTEAEAQRRGREEERGRLEAAEAELRSLRAYLGAGALVETEAPSSADQGVQTDDGEEGGCDGEEEAKASQVELLVRQVAALREIVAVMEAHMAGGAGKEGGGLVARWRQEVFGAIVARRAAEVAAAEAEREAQGREAELQETLRASQCSQQVAQNKLLTSEAETQMLRASEAAAKDEATAARKAAAEGAARLQEAEQALLGLAQQARLAAAAGEAAQRRLKSGEGRVEALARRLVFAEDRLRAVLAALESRPRASDVEEAQLMAETLRAENAELEVHLSRSREALRAREDAAAELRASAAKASAERIAVETEAREEAARVIAEAEQRLEEACAEAEAATEELRLLRADVGTHRAKASASEAELKECKAKLEEAARALEASAQSRRDAEAGARDALRAREEEHRRKEAALSAEYEEENRQAAKMAVTVRQMERQIVRLQEKQASISEDRISELERKLHEKDAALRSARRERNALLAAQRNGGPVAGSAEARPQQQQQQPKAAEVASLSGSPPRRAPRTLPSDGAQASPGAADAPPRAAGKGAAAAPPAGDAFASGSSGRTYAEEELPGPSGPSLPPVQLEGLFATPAPDTEAAASMQQQASWSPAAAAGFWSTLPSTHTTSTPPVGSMDGADGSGLLFSRLSDLEKLTESLLEDD